MAVAPAHAADTTTASLADGIKALPFAAEHRNGYERTKFKHWVDADKDSCNTRAEALTEEAVTRADRTTQASIPEAARYLGVEAEKSLYTEDNTHIWLKSTR